MSKRQQISVEAFKAVASHYAAKIIEKNPEATEKDVQVAIQNNWENITKEVSKLYSMAVAECQA